MSIKDDSFLSVISSTVLQDGPYTDLSYHAPYLLLQNKNGYTVYSVGDNLSLKQYYLTQPTTTLTADIAVINVIKDIPKNNLSREILISKKFLSHQENAMAY